MQKRSTGGGEPDALDFFHASAAHALMHGVVLAIDGQQRFVLSAGFGGNEFTRGDKTFFVGQADGFACLDRFVGSFESGYAHDRANNEINLWMRSHCDVAFRAVFYTNGIESSAL